MKKLVVIWFFFLTAVGCGPVEKPIKTLPVKANPVNKKTLAFNKNLPQYTVDTCLLALLKAMVQSNKKHYNPHKNFYSLSWHTEKQYRWMGISVQAFDNAEKHDYKGLVYIDGYSILCYGDFDKDVIFRKTLNSRNINVKIGSEHEPYIHEPVLQGTFHECSGLPIYIEIYAKEKIGKYQMKIKPDKLVRIYQSNKT